MTLRATASAGNGQTTGLLTLPIVVPTSGSGGTVAAGDVAVLCAQAVSTGGATLTTPTGWTLVSGPHQIGASSCLTNVFRKTLVSGDLGATVNLTYSGAVRATAGMIVESGVTATGATAFSAIETSSTATPTLPTATSVPTGAAVLAFMPRRYASTPAPTADVPTGFSPDLIDIATAFGSAAEALMVAGRLTAPSAGSYGGTAGATGSATTGTNYVIVLPSTGGNAAPTVSAGANQTGVTAGATVTLTATAADSDGTVSSVVWSQTGGTPTVTLGGSGATRTFTAPSVTGGTTLTFSVTATDNAGATATDSMTVAVLPPPGITTTGKILTAEGAANGAVLVSGGSYGGDAVDSVAKTAGGNLVVSNAAGKMGRGANSVRITSAAATDTAIARYTVPASPDISVQFTFVPDALPTANTVIATLRSASATISQIQYLATSGKIRVTDTVGTVWDSSGAYPTTGVPRIAVFADRTSGTMKIRVYANPTTTTALYTVDAAATLGTADFEAAQIGKSSTTSILNAHYDDFRVSTTATDILPPEGAGNTPPTANAGADQANIEPWATVTITGTDSDSDGTVVDRAWAQTSGSPTVTLVGSGASRTFEAPGTIAGTTLTFTYTATDSAGASTSDAMTVAVLPVTERAVVGGVEVPMQVRRT